MPHGQVGLWGDIQAWGEVPLLAIRHEPVTMSHDPPCAYRLPLFAVYRVPVGQVLIGQAKNHTDILISAYLAL